MLKSVFILGLTTVFYLAFGDNNVKTNEDTATQAATKMFARDFSFRRHKVYADIRCGSRVRRRQLAEVSSKATDFQCH